MALYPHTNRRKRLETAGMAALLYLTVAGLIAGAMYVSPIRLTWGNLRGFGPFAIFGLVGAVALVRYVRGGQR